jgi:hypothetical protein
LYKLVPKQENNIIAGMAENAKPIRVIMFGARVSGRYSTIFVAAGL